MTIRVLIVDDQAMFRLGLSAILAAQPDMTIVGEAADGGEAIRLAGELQPDVILMDVRMPGVDGIEATRLITAVSLETQPPRVVMLTTFDIDDYVFDALRAGASGFLLKDATPDELAGAIRTVAAGDSLLSPSATRALIAEFVDSAAPSRINDAASAKLAALTARELDVFALIAGGLSNGEISDRLHIAEQTTKSHIGRIFLKLGVRDRAQAVVLAYEAGVVRPGG